MKTRSLIAAIAAFGLSTLAFTGDAFATKIFPIQGKYSKIKLDGICAANGGASYGTAGGSYGCSKGKVSVECHNDGSCKGYVDLEAAPSGKQIGNTAEAVLQQAPAPATQGTKGGTAGGALTTP